MPVNGTRTLVEYERKRQEQRFIPYVSDISDVGESKVKLVTVRGLPSNPRFDLIVQSKHLSVGDDDFFVIGDRMDPEHPYRYLTVEALAGLKLDRKLVISGHPKPGRDNVPGQVTVHGRLEANAGSELNLVDGGRLTVEIGGTLAFQPGSSLVVDDRSELIVAGCICLPAEMVDRVISDQSIRIEPSATVKLTELPGARAFSLTDYVAELRSGYHPVGSGASRSMSNGNAQASYAVVAGSTDQPSQVIDLTVDRGEVILGDLNLVVGGRPRELEPHDRIIDSITVAKDAQLSIGTSFMGDRYLRPTLILEPYRPGASSPKLIIDGLVEVQDSDGSIELSGNAMIVIEEGGELRLKADGSIEHATGESTVLINGRLVIERLEQLGSRNPRNYVFGPTGKLIVMNPSPTSDWERQLLFSIPNGFRSSLLATLFGDRLDRVEFHLNRHCGIAIDADMSPFHRWSDWYNGVRLERAIAEGWLVWHDGAYLEVDRHALPWLKVERGLTQLTKLFKSYRDTDRERLQDLVDRLVFAGCGDLIFRVVDEANNLVAETTLSLASCKLLTASYDPRHERYGVTATNDGELFMVSPADGTEPEALLVEQAKVVDVPIVTHRTTFTLP